jgi:hypothetical protein
LVTVCNKSGTNPKMEKCQVVDLTLSGKVSRLRLMWRVSFRREGVSDRGGGGERYHELFNSCIAWSTGLRVPWRLFVCCLGVGNGDLVGVSIICILVDFAEVI